MDHASIQFQFQILNPSAVQALNPLLSDAGWEDSLIKFQTPVRTGAIVENTRQQAFMVSSRAKRENEGTGRTIICFIPRIFKMDLKLIQHMYANIFV